MISINEACILEYASGEVGIAACLLVGGASSEDALYAALHGMIVIMTFPSLMPSPFHFEVTGRGSHVGCW
jgi:hypothetical protein